MNDVSKEVRCPEVNADGLPCQRLLWVDSQGEVQDFHSGGHHFASDKVWAHMTNPDIHLDATALLSGQPATSHPAAECTKTGFCAWRR